MAGTPLTWPLIPRIGPALCFRSLLLATQYLIDPRRLAYCYVASQSFADMRHLLFAITFVAAISLLHWAAGLSCPWLIAAYILSGDAVLIPSFLISARR